MTPTTAFGHALLNAPWWIAGLLIIGLILHIAGGSIGILSGYAAVSVKKGADWHRAAGLAFVLGMLVMSAAAVGLAVPLHEPSNVAGGVLTAYLVATGLLAVNRPPGAIGTAEKAAFAVILAIAAAMLGWAAQAWNSPGHALAGFSWVLYFVFGCIASALAATDLRVIRRGGLLPHERIRRHLWRMCFAFFFASASFFLGQQKVMPRAIHGSPLLWVLGLAPLAFMIYWLVRTRPRTRTSAAAMPAE
ncbi:MAG TPA: hypothetical protein VMU08_10010 [Rhizomicrobium sp.]|nr:hypothetical protein [Rhizomicrobium sp.]